MVHLPHRISLAFLITYSLWWVWLTPKHVEWTCRIINRLPCVASRWTIIKNFISDARNHEHKIPRLCLWEVLLYLLLRNINKVLQETYFLFLPSHLIFLIFLFFRICLCTPHHYFMFKLLDLNFINIIIIHYLSKRQHYLVFIMFSLLSLYCHVYRNIQYRCQS